MNHFLLIDDDEVSNFIHNRVILSADPEAVITEQQSSVKAIEFLKIRLAEAASFPDFIFIDINMPEMNGFGILQVIQDALTGAIQYTDIYMLSSSLYDRDRERAMQFSFVKGFLEKPLNKQRILEIIQAH